MKNINIIKKIDSLWTRQKPLPWPKKGWENYQDGVHGATQRIANLGELTPREMFSVIWKLDDLAYEWKEKAIVQDVRGRRWQSELTWYTVMGIDDVKEVLVKALDEYLAQGEHQSS